jgi:hypothetical protein
VARALAALTLQWREPMPMRKTKPDARQCALLLLALLEKRATKRNRTLSRARLSELTLRKLWQRNSFGPSFVFAVNEWLNDVSWAIFFAGTTYGAVRTGVVESWTTVAAKWLAEDADAIAGGTYDYADLEQTLFSENNDEDAEDEEDADDDTEISQ